MICPICKNKYGFVCGTCIDCGYNQHSNEFNWIKIDNNILKSILSHDEELYNQIIEQYEQQMKN